MEKGVGAGCIASCLTHHATSLSFAVCNDPVLIFETILGQILKSLPERKVEFDEGLVEQITHNQPTNLLN